jgi:hypothetical protein
MRALLVVVALLVFLPAPADAQGGFACTKCNLGCCAPTNFNAQKQCIALTDCTYCRSWQDCTGPLGEEPQCGLPGQPPCEPGCRETERTWRLAAVTVQPARMRESWTLTDVRLRYVAYRRE